MLLLTSIEALATYALLSNPTRRRLEAILIDTLVSPAG